MLLSKIYDYEEIVERRVFCGNDLIVLFVFGLRFGCFVFLWGFLGVLLLSFLSVPSLSRWFGILEDGFEKNSFETLGSTQREHPVLKSGFTQDSFHKSGHRPMNGAWESIEGFVRDKTRMLSTERRRRDVSKRLWGEI